MGGYQSDVDLKDLNLVGDISAENTTGGFGETEGSASEYTLQLDPPITSYRIGMPLQVKFHISNEDGSTLNVNGLGAVPVKKIVNNELQDLKAGDLTTSPIYDLKFDGEGFQVVTLISSGANNGEAVIEGGLTLKGYIDASTFPQFPSAKKGDLYTVTQDGYIGDSDGGSGLQVSIGDVVYATEDNEGGAYAGLQDKWNGLSGKGQFGGEET